MYVVMQGRLQQLMSGRRETRRERHFAETDAEDEG